MAVRWYGSNYAPKISYNWRYAGTLAGAVGGVPASWYWQAMILVCYETSLRVGAVRSLEVEDFHPHGPALLIRSETQKTLLGRCLPLSAVTAALLAEHLYSPICNERSAIDVLPKLNLEIR